VRRRRFPAICLPHPLAGAKRFNDRLVEVSGDLSKLQSSTTIEVEEGIFDLDLYDLPKRFLNVY
jgi:hypothetical protein